MSSPESIEPSVEEPPASPCRHLRNKGMYVYTDGPGGEPEDGCDNSIYWCLQTMKGYGPDDELVDGRDCRTASRSCYEPF